MPSLRAVAVSCWLAVSTVTARAVQTSSYDLVEHESTENLPASWSLHSIPSDEEHLRLRVALRQPHQDYVRIAHEVSDPDSPRYGMHLSASELKQAMPDMKKAAQAVEAWLNLTGARHVERDDDEWVSFTTSIGEVRKFLNAEFARYAHAAAIDEPVLRTKSYSVPSHLTDMIDFIYPATQFISPQVPKQSLSELRRRQHIPTGPPTCDNSTCPAQLKKKYNIDYSPKDAKSGSKLGIAGFLEQYASNDDAQQFFKTYGFRNDSTPYKFTVELINNGTNPTAANASGVEAMLDIDYSMVFADPIPTTFYSTGGRPPTLNDHGTRRIHSSKSMNEPWLDFFQYLLKQEHPPQVISMSYSDTEQTVPIKYAQRVCNLLARLAARGVTVIGASGDGGASGTGNSDCINSKGKKSFLPTFPSSCPWITSVGATAGYGGGASFSSGGFSNYFSRPTYQDSAVSGYIKALNGSHRGYYNASGRGIPDVSLLGDDFLIISGGYASSHDGTSASTPVFAAMIALVNDIRLRAGKPVLGFLNPLIYSKNASAIFTDIKKGDSNGCSDDSGFEPGYQALKDWDAVTGLGEPDFARLRKFVS